MRSSAIGGEVKDESNYGIGAAADGYAAADN